MLLGEAESMADVCFRGGRVSGGCVFLGEAESVADVCFQERQSQWRMCVFRGGRVSGGCVF